MINAHPYYGIRRIVWAINLKRAQKINWKAIYRIIRVKNWTMNKRPAGMRPRVRGWVSRAQTPNERWAIDTTHFSTERDGWCHLTAVIDCCDRMIVGWRASSSGKAKVACGALEDALINRKPPQGMFLRSDNGLVFASRLFQRTARRAGVRQQFITPYTPEQNGIIERWFRSLKEECLWLRSFSTLAEAQNAIGDYIEKYNNQRPHQALGMKPPALWSQKFAA